MGITRCPGGMCMRHGLLTQMVVTTKAFLKFSTDHYENKLYLQRDKH